jgi:hypothetical protein
VVEKAMSGGLARSTFDEKMLSEVSWCHSQEPRLSDVLTPTSDSSRKRWESLLSQLIWIDRDEIGLITPRLLDEPSEAEPVPVIEEDELSKLWAALGGLRGLLALQKNSDVLIELALYWQQWHPEVLVITERLRSDAQKLEWYVSRLQVASRTGKLGVTVPYYAPRAVSLYYGMTHHVLCLYSGTNRSMFAALRRVL